MGNIDPLGAVFNNPAGSEGGGVGISLMLRLSSSNSSRTSAEIAEVTKLLERMSGRGRVSADSLWSNSDAGSRSADGRTSLSGMRRGRALVKGDKGSVLQG